MARREIRREGLIVKSETLKDKAESKLIKVEKSIKEIQKVYTTDYKRALSLSFNLSRIVQTAMLLELLSDILVDYADHNDSYDYSDIRDIFIRVARDRVIDTGLYRDQAKEIAELADEIFDDYVENNLL